MSWRKNIILIVGGGIALLLMIVALVFLLKSRGEFQRVNDSLGQGMQRLETLTRRSPYPSPANIQQVEKNLAALKDAASILQETLQRGQVQPESIEAAEFAPMLERASKKLYQRAAEAGVTLPERFNLGLSRYAEGELPATDAIPRLVIQLKSLDVICQILFQAHIQSLISVERQQFESGAGPSVEEVASPRRRVFNQEQQPSVSSAAIPLPASNTLYEVERFNVSFQARDASVWEVLNQLARSPLLIAVADVQLTNVASEKLGKATPVAPIGGEQAAAASGFARYPSHEERVIAGRELVQASLVLDVYRLVKEIKEDAP